MSEESTTKVQPEADTGPKPVSWAPIPKVNLLPVEIVENRAFRRTQLVLAGLVVVVVGAIGAGTVWAQSGVDDAQAEADTAQARVADLQQQQTEYAEVPKIYAQVEAATAARKQVYVGDVPWSRYVNQLDRARPSGLEFKSVQMTLSATGAAVPAVDPLTPAAVATLAIDGDADNYTQVADWMTAFEKVRGLQSAELKSAAEAAASGDTTTTSSDPSIEFASTGVVGAQSLSGRYQKPEQEKK
ncbi:hypothetical protein LWF15_31145 [Kineosporia rhizophila]|uniref:hypothetical protein n=1 Tax=Kineosporia rhizophila TaxID=84633 RepID=UPI001E530620|nr:hypothetical protein [Kineosporia rhizophila]MCE0539962.1 hypothetical protein [Kineosporia rhizophila]